MIKIYDSGFTETLWRYIKKISLKALQFITPANFLYITDSKLNNIDQSNLFFVDDAVVNSTQMGAINSSIAYLKPNNIETLTLTQEVTFSDLNANVGNEDYYIVSFTIPEGFDGRKCFPYIKINDQEEWTCADRIYADLYSSARTRGICGHVVRLNADRVEFKFWLGIQSLSTFDTCTLNLELWRNK